MVRRTNFLTVGFDRMDDLMKKGLRRELRLALREGPETEWMT